MTKYVQSDDSKKMKTYKDIYMGKRCFIIGNGSSLTIQDLELIRKNNDISFGANRIYKLFNMTKWRPTYYMMVDPDGMEELLSEINPLEYKQLFIDYDGRKTINSSPDNLIFANVMTPKFVLNKYNDKSMRISEDASKYICAGWTVTFAAIQLAIYMGIKEIYLLGVDFDYSWITDKWGKKRHIEGVKDYFDGKKYYGSYLNYESTLNAYKCAAEYGRKNGIKIFNATRGGKLEVFERCDFNKLFDISGGI